MMVLIWLIIIFIVLPAIEISLFLWTGSELGILPVAMIIILTGIIGIALVKKQGLETWRRAQLSMYHNEVPAEEIVDGICIIVGGIFLLTPGFFTDTLGFLLVIPFTRKPFKYIIKTYVMKKMAEGKFLFRRW